MLRSLAKKLAFHAGVFDLLHRLRNRECLTVIMLHRVLPAGIQREMHADPAYTVTPEFLSECLEFLRRRYTIVSLEDVLRSRNGVVPLPPWPLLVTFDDGWLDNLEWGAPVLTNYPWAVFVSTDAVLEPGAWWQEVLLAALRSGDPALRAQAERGATSSLCDDAADLPSDLRLLLAYGALPPEWRDQQLRPLRTEGSVSRLLNPIQLGQLSGAGASIAAHGASHLPLTHIADPAADMHRARESLRTIFPQRAISALSFPHGRWNADLARTARQIGYELLFTSDPQLNPCPSGWLASDIIGRIPIASHDVTQRQGGLAGDRMAPWLYRRTMQRPVNV